MKILYSYIGKSIFKYFFILIGFFSVVIVSSQLLHLPSIIYHSGLIKFLQVLFYVNLSFFKYQLFFGFFLSSVLVGYSLREKREIYAVYSAGISKNQLIFPVAVVSFIFVATALVISLVVVPFANRERAEFITINVKKHILDSIVQQNFLKLSDDITIYVSQKEDNKMEDIFIYNKAQGITITAKQAEFSNNRLVLKNGYIQFPSEDGYSILKFEKYRFVLDVKYIKKYEFEDMENKKLLEIVRSNPDLKNRALAVLADRILFGIPFVFIGITGFLMGLQIQSSRDYVVTTAIFVSILYLIINTYFVKLIQKGSVSPLIYGLILTIYFGSLTVYFYRKK